MAGQLARFDRDGQMHYTVIEKFLSMFHVGKEEIIRIYGKRRDIEVFFKTCKTYLRLQKECHSLSYDAMTAHVAIVMVRYMIDTQICSYEKH